MSKTNCESTSVVWTLACACAAAAVLLVVVLLLLLVNLLCAAPALVLVLLLLVRVVACRTHDGSRTILRRAPRKKGKKERDKALPLFAQNIIHRQRAKTNVPLSQLF